MTSKVSQEQSNPGVFFYEIKKLTLSLWHFHRKFIITLMIVFAMTLLIVRSVTLYLEHNPQLIKNLVESNLQIKIDFDDIAVNVNPLYPSVSMQGFVIQNSNENEKAQSFKSAKVQIDLWRSINNGQVIVNKFRLDGFSTQIRRNRDGVLSIGDFEFNTRAKQNVSQKQEKPPYLSLLEQTHFIISGNDVLFVDEMQEYPSISIADFNFEMNNSNEQHQISLQASLNESELSLDVRLDFSGNILDINQWSGEIYTSLENLDQPILTHLLNRDELQIEDFQVDNITAGAKIWTAIKKGRLQSIQGQLMVKDAKLKRIENGKSIHFDNLTSNFKLQRQTNEILEDGQKRSNWFVNLYDLNLNVNSRPITEKYIHLKIHQNSRTPVAQMQFYLNKIQLEEFSHVIAFFSPVEFSQKVYRILKPKGALENIIATLKLNVSASHVDILSYQVQMDVNDFAMNALFSLPKIRHFSARVILNEEMGRAFIDSHEMKVHLKSLFRDAWPITQLSGEIYWQKENNLWLIGGENIDFKNIHLNAQADLKLWLAENGQMFMDLSGFYHDANVTYTSFYLPVTIMSSGLVKWLDEAIISGWGTDGGVVFRGNLDQFPYVDHSGSMDIVFNTKDVVLEFAKDWPKLNDIQAQVQFTEQGMRVDSQQSKIFSARSSNIQAEIEDYLHSDLTIRGDIRTNVSDAVNFLQQAELVSDDVLKMLDAKDEFDLNLDLKIPMEEGEPESKITVSLNDADYYPPDFDKKKNIIRHLRGDIIVHNNSINSKNLTAQVMGQTAKVKIKTAKRARGATKDPDISVAIDTKASIEQLKSFALIPPSLFPLSQKLSGSSPVKLNIYLPNQHRGMSFHINSDLQGIRSDLPIPFTKSADMISSFAINVFENKNQTSQFNLTIADHLSLALLLDRRHDELEVLKGGIGIGGIQARLPHNNSLKISGKINDIPFAQWQKVFVSQNKNKSSENSANKASINKTKSIIPIELALTEFVIPKWQKDEQSSVEKRNYTENNPSDALMPNEFPLINGSINSLKLGSVDLGRMTINTHRAEQNIILDALNLQGSMGTFETKGQWSTKSDFSEFSMNSVLQVPSLEVLLKTLNYDGTIRKGKLKLSGSINWPGGPTEFSKKTMSGKFKLNVEKGNWIEGKPGPAGRLLGLINLNVLSRRLSLDFTDVSNQGFEFDLIQGDFSIFEGNLHTKNLTVIASNANILIEGRTGLINGDLDQTITVIPEISATLPIAGAVVAGPAGAAVAWVGQKLLGKQLNKVSAFGYTIKGQWDAPEVKKNKIAADTLKKLSSIFKQTKESDNNKNSSVLDLDGTQN